MTFGEIVEAFPDSEIRGISPALVWLKFRLSQNLPIRNSQLTPALVRELAGCCYLSDYNAGSRRDGEPCAPVPAELLDTLEQLVMKVASQEERHDCEAVVSELRHTLPTACELAARLSNYTANRGGPFVFPEFLTSFEDGGRSEYDLDLVGDRGAIEGYFRVDAVAGCQVAAEELISETAIEPILFPSDVAEILTPGYILTLELVCKAGAWEIVGCGLVYPPKTPVGADI